MRYESEHGYGTVDFWDPYYKQLNQYSKIGINLSGGADSALVAYLTCLELSERELDTEVNFITGVHNARPTNEWNAREIVDLFKTWFPNINWGSHYIDYYDKTHEKDKVNHHRDHEDKLRSEGKIDVLFHGRTANPSKEEAEKHNLMFKREERRDKDVHSRPVFHTNHDKPFYCPLEYVDKRWVAEMYERFDLMEHLFPITASCVEYADKTNFFTEPCKECWWCREKKWAFGVYDGGII